MKHIILMLCVILMSAACGRREVRIEVFNGNDFDCSGEMVEVSADSLSELLGSTCLYVVDQDGKEIPSQITGEGKLIFPVDVKACSDAVYRIFPSDTLHSYRAVVAGRLYPERADDVAWENENVGFRIYGPATQAKGEKAFGYDIFFKHPTEDLIVERLYAPETDPATWEKVDSLRGIDPSLAEDFIKTFSYHIDHGLGMDCYAVGPTLGAGVAALVENDSICFPWCYEKATVTDNGPLRFTVILEFPSVPVGNDTVVEHREISLNSGSHLNSCKVWYDGLKGKRRIAAGFPLRDDSAVVMDAANNIIAYADPTQGPDNGKAMLGMMMAGDADSIYTSEGHILISSMIHPSDTLEYFWGFAWDKTPMKDMESWKKYLDKRSALLRNPLRISIR